MFARTSSLIFSSLDEPRARILFGLVALVVLGAIMLACQQGARRDSVLLASSGMRVSKSPPQWNDCDTLKIDPEYGGRDSMLFVTLFPTLPSDWNRCDSTVWRGGGETSWLCARSACDSALLALASRYARQAQKQGDTLMIDDHAEGSLPGIMVRGGRILGTEDHYLHIRATIQVEDDLFTVAALYRCESGQVERQAICRVAAYPSWLFDGDTLQDVNGDGWRDYIWKRDGSGGYLSYNDCIHLYNPVLHSFSDGIEGLCHPTYYPKEGMIRGMECANPSNRGLYKARFNGSGIEIVEYLFLSPAPENSDCFDPEKLGFVRRRRGSAEFLRTLPEEYRDVEYLKTFLSPP